MLTVAHRLLVVLIAFAIVGGTTVQLARSAQRLGPIAVAGMPCDMSMPGMGAEHGKPMMPCKNMTPDCIKQLGCVADAAVPARLVSVEPAVHSNPVHYWFARSGLTSFIPVPEPLPPRAI